MRALFPIIKPIKHYDFVSFDIETYTRKNLFLFGGVFDSKYHFFCNKDVMIKYLSNYQNIIATNLGFDFNSLFIGKKEFFDYNIVMKNGNYLFCVKEKQRFIDTLNITPSSVQKLGLMLNIPKHTKPLCLGKKPLNRKEWGYMKRYNARDCIITKRFIEYFQKALNMLGGEFKPTIASCALNLYQRRFMKKPIYPEPININRLIFQSYYGGRVEAIKRGLIKDHNYYDFNSLYPSVMINNYPKPSSLKHIKNPNEHNIRKYEGISDIIIESPKIMQYPFLPYRGIDGKLLFPIGTWRGVYTHIELRKALSLGYKIIKYYKQYIYTQTFKPFTRYVKTLYTLRQKYKREHNDIMQYACKILLNSLYGKFATKILEETRFFMEENRVRKNYYNLQDGISYTIQKKICDRPYVLPILSSYTTAYGRIRLYEEIIRHNAIYYDTDSIITKDEIKTLEGLGELKLEHKIKRGYIIRPKTYMINNIIKIKGLHNATKKDFYMVLSGKIINKKKFIKIKESIRQKLRVNEILSIHKKIDLEDNKRYWRGKYRADRLQSSKPLYIYDMRKHSPKAYNEDIL